MVVNQYPIWDPKFENKYPSKLKILTSSLSLKKKLENGNLRIVPVEFAKFTYPIYVLFKVYSIIPFSEDSFHVENSQLIYKSNQIDLLASMWCGILLKGVFRTEKTVYFPCIWDNYFPHTQVSSKIYFQICLYTFLYTKFILKKESM